MGEDHLCQSLGLCLVTAEKWPEPATTNSGLVALMTYVIDSIE
jgi:hypothetical protein